MQAKAAFLLLTLLFPLAIFALELECTYISRTKEVATLRTDVQLSGIWTTLSAQQTLGYAAIAGIKPYEPIFLVAGSFRSVYFACLKELEEKTNSQCHLGQLLEIKAKKDGTTSGYLLYRTENLELAFVAKNNKVRLENKLRKYNFSPILNGLVYRSSALGKTGIKSVQKTLKRSGYPMLKTVASIHVKGFGGRGNNYNLEELSYCSKHGLTFLHTFHSDPHLAVYFDGTNPHLIAEDTPDHGNIFKKETLDRFIPDPNTRQDLEIEQSIQSGRSMVGNTSDFLQSLENIIDAPWPILFHCKGGKHKTGMLAIAFEYLLRSYAQLDSSQTSVKVPVYLNRIDQWLNRRIPFCAIFSRPLHEVIALRPEEQSYFTHNHDVFRKENIEFMRGVTDGVLLSPKLKEHWQNIQRKFFAKIAEYGERKWLTADQERHFQKDLSTSE